MKRRAFRREERLKSRKTIEHLFSDGKSFGQYPLRLIYAPKVEKKGEALVQIAVSVPKRKFPRAVHRNRIKRQVKEAWRLHKHVLYQKLSDEDRQFGFMLIYTAREALDYAQIEQAMKGVIHRFAKKWKQQQRKERDE